MSDNEDDPVKGRSENPEFAAGEVEPRHTRSERLDRRVEPLPEAGQRGGVLAPTGGISQDACDHSTVLATGGRPRKDQVGSDQSICGSTSGGKCVVLTSTDHHFSADDLASYEQYTFAVQVFPGPQPT